ncbi:hypothetical protein V7S43_001711 [Phytophthora oleae]|uniref:PX domain-containing protein n=1 Tax=Phytophthora oleae TaxID=2107226 RepID=A0ABD3G4G7_9STRA
MGASASAPPSLSEERFKRETMDEGFYPAFKIDVETTDCFVLSVGAAGHLGQPLHHLPLGLLKRILLELRLHQPLEETLVVAATSECSPIDVKITSSRVNQHPGVPTQALPCCHLRLEEIGKTNSVNNGVQVYKHEVQRPIIEPPYTVFKMKIYLGELKWRIARRYSEFAELHTRLKMVVDGSTLPQLPPTTWLSATDPSFLFQRRVQLENYLKGVFMIEDLLDSPLLVFWEYYQQPTSTM